MKKQTSSKRHFYQRKPFLWTAGSIIGLVLIVGVLFRVTPWPGALIIRAVFDKGDVKTLQALEKHAPSVPITAITDQQYRDNDKDAQLDVYFPQNADKNAHLPTVIWTHGGAWVSGGKGNVAPYYELLAAEGFAVISLDYSLAPEHRYPTAVQQLNDAHAYIKKNANRFHVDTNKLFLAGDSAGAQLSSQLAAIITNSEYAGEMAMTPSLQPNQLRGVILNCGIYKMHELTTPDPTLPKIIGWGDDVSVWAYSGTKDFTDPVINQMSAYFHVTADFPATFITGGNGDPLTKVQSMPFARELEALGVKVTTLFYADDHQPSLPHEYQFDLDSVDGENAFRQIVNFVKTHSA